MRATWAVALSVATRLARAGAHGFSVHDDLLAYPQYQVALDDSYVLEAEAQSKLDFASSQSSAKPAQQTSSEHAVSVVKSAQGKAGSTEADGDGSDLPQSYEYMMLNSTPYLCSIPRIREPESNETSPPVSQEEEAKELERARTRGSQLIGDMDGACLYYISGWWSYSFCRNSEVKQFHALPPGQNGAPHFPPLEDPNVPSFILGHYDGPKSIDSGRRAEKDSDWDENTKATDLVEVQSSGDLRYLVQKLGDGTICDLTNRPRKVEVQYHCAPGPSDKISSVKEISTCSYRMVVYTPRLCDDVAFQPPPEIPQHRIVCSEIVSEEALPEWKLKKEAEAKQKVADTLADQLASNKDSLGSDDAQAPAKPKIMIGGIELGGQKTVGGPGKRIEPPKETVAPQNKQNPIIIAKYDPKQNDGQIWILPDKELTKLEIHKEDMDEIKSMTEELFKMGRDKRWKIIMTEREDRVRILEAVIEEDVNLDALAESKDAKKDGKKDGSKEAKSKKKKEEARNSEDSDDEKGSEEEYFQKDEL